MDRKKEERHRFLQESQVVFPQRDMVNTRHWSSRFGFGYHSFDFALKVPWYPECCACPPNSPVSRYSDGEKDESRPLRNLPPSMMNTVKGAEIVYSIDVTVTTIRNLFKFTTRKRKNINVWPIDAQPISTAGRFTRTKSLQANILGPPISMPAQGSQENIGLTSTVDSAARILITASFLPDFNIARHRDIAMHLSVKQLHPSPHKLYLQSFQMLLVGYTDIQMETAKSGQMSFWTIQSLGNLKMEIFSGEEDGRLRTERDIYPGLWEGKRFPDDAAPTFQACNLARRYELEILMGFQCRGGSKDQVGRPSFVQLPVPVHVSSGIPPNRRLNETLNKEISEELLIALEEAPAHEHHIANGFEHYSLLRGDVGRHDQSELPPTPPTYEEATAVAANKNCTS